MDVSGPQGSRTTAQVPLSGPELSNAQAELLGHLREATLGEYDVVGELGRGGMATVYLAHDIALDRQVAIKVMHPGLLMGEGMIDRFKREARTAASLTHPHIIPIHLVRETPRILFFVMKYVEGRSLDTIIAQQGALPIKMAETILLQVGGALGYAHRRGVVHRDVKPANIMIDSEGWAVVTDFGIAKVAEAGSLTMSGTTVGTPYYMSPEQCSARPVTGASDQYSLGIVCFEMLAGKTPFTGDSLMDIMRKHFFETPPDLGTVRPDCPAALAGVVSRMLAKEPAQRWPSVEGAIGAIGAQSLGHDDPVRTQMVELARSGVKPIARLPVPSSPTPIGRPSSTKPPPPPVARDAAKPVSPRRRAPKGFGWGVAVIVLAGAALVTRQVVRSTPDKPSAAAPPAVTDSIVAIEIRGMPDHIGVGEAVQLSASATNPTGNIVSSATFQWSSDDSTVASIASGGLVRGVAMGNTYLTAAAGGRRDSARIVVRAPPVASLQIVPSTARIGAGQSLRLSLVAIDARGGRSPVGPALWSSGDPAVAIVSTSGVVTGIAPGIATLAASSGDRRALAQVSVLPPAVATLVITPGSVRLRVGESVRLNAVPRDAAGRELDGREVQWGSSDRSIATVSGTGMVTGMTPGTAGVTAMADGVKSERASVTVAPLIPLAPGTLRLLITPWAYVSIDNHSWGQRDRLEQTVPSGIPHRLHLEREGFVTVDTTVTVNASEVRLVRIQMTRSP